MLLLLLFFILGTHGQINGHDGHDHQENYNNQNDQESDKRYFIKNILIKTIHKDPDGLIGLIDYNGFVPEETILTKIPYKSGDLFDPTRTSIAIRNLWDLGYFREIKLLSKNISDSEMDLYIAVDLKKKFGKITYTGNKHLTEKEIEKKFKISELKSIDEEQVQEIVSQLKTLYREKNYHDVVIETKIVPETDLTSNVEINIKENNKTTVQRIFFEGNKSIDEETLRNIIYTREEWILSFFDKSGMYLPDMIEQDKYLISNYYQSNGFLTAAVKDVKIEADKYSNLAITFVIEEGETFTINKVSVPGNDILPETELRPRLPLFEGMLYSKDNIRKAIEILRNIWGEFGYIYADIDPQVEPNFEDKTVDLTLKTDLGKPIKLNQINIIGNKKTRDKIIRRQITFDEGGLITNRHMEISKNRIEALGFFEPKDGVNWKIKKINEDTADLDLILKEIKTGSITAQVGTGGADKDASSPSTSWKIGVEASDRNLMGTGIQSSLSAQYSRQEFGLGFNLVQPWLMDRPILAGLNIFHQKTTYEEFRTIVAGNPVETATGANTTFGYQSPKLNDTAFLFRIGYRNQKYDSITLSENSQVQMFKVQFQNRLDRTFVSGDIGSLEAIVSQNTFNNPLFPTMGYQWSLTNKYGHSVISSSKGGCFNYFKSNLDASWCTPLINEYSLILYLHGHVGLVGQFNNGNVPYRELYNIGGPSTVRGFTFGQIGPQLFGDPLGSKKGFWVNVELRFPITSDFSIKGLIFYDGGAGWDPVNEANAQVQQSITNKFFNYRHSVGIGVRLTQPTPVKIDWGFKLDRNKRLGEKIDEVHFTMTHEF